MTAIPASLFHFAICLRHLMTKAKTASPLESAGHSSGWFHERAVSYLTFAGEGYSYWCAVFVGPSYIQEGAYRRLSARTVSWLQGGLDGLFV